MRNAAFPILKVVTSLFCRFGDLRIMLNIKFPTSLSPEEKNMLRSVLDEGEIAKLEATIERKALLSGFQDYLKPVGNLPVFHKSEDITSNAYVLLVDAALSAPGRVVEWTFAAVRECELAFQVWRPGPLFEPNSASLYIVRCGGQDPPPPATSRPTLSTVFS